jgi:cyanophycinase
MSPHPTINPALAPFFSRTFEEVGVRLSANLREFHGLGALVLIGGAEDQEGDLQILRTTWELNRASRVVVCPSASRISDEVGRDYKRLFSRIGARAVDVIDPESPEDADQDRYLEAVSRADLLFFSGGDQVKLASLLLGTRFLDMVRRRFLEGATIAGTSAGAAAAANPMIYDGNRKGFHKGSVKSAPGFGFVDNLIVDTHFHKRRRLARLSQAIASGLCTMGLGLDEDTGIILRGDGDFTVIGTQMVTVLGGKRMKRNTFHAVEEDEIITVTGLRVGFLAPGTTFNIGSWSAL